MVRMVSGPKNPQGISKMLQKGFSLVGEGTLEDRRVRVYRGAGLIVDDVVTRSGLSGWVYGKNEPRKENLSEARQEVLPKLEAGESALVTLASYNASVDAMVREMAQEVIDKIGPPPCEMALMALGSFGRKELNPYSDLDYGILLEKTTANSKRWARRFASAFNTKVKQLGETTVFYTRGLRSCTTHSPVGFNCRELVGSCERFLGLFERARPQDQGLRDNLMNPRCVVGSPELVVQLKQTIGQRLLQPDGLQRLMLDVTRGYLPSGEVRAAELDVKDVLFRSFVYPGVIMSIAWNLESTHSAERLKEAQAKGLVDASLANAVEKAIDYSVGLRLSSHAKAGKEEDLLQLSPEQAVEFNRHHRVLMRYVQLAKKLSENPDQNPFVRRRAAP